MTRLSLKASAIKKGEEFNPPTKDDIPEFLKDCKAFSRISINNSKEGATPYLERMLGWKIKNPK